MREVPARVQRDPQETSVLAAGTVDVASQQQRVAAFLRDRGEYGATDQEMQRELGIQRARTRRQALVDQGIVVDSGKRGVTESGHSAIVWKWVPPDIEVHLSVAGDRIAATVTPHARSTPAPRPSVIPSRTDERKYGATPRRKAHSKSPAVQRRNEERDRRAAARRARRESDSD